MTDKRKHMRLALNLGVTIKLPNGNTITGRTKNISFGGVMILTDDLVSCESGTLCHVSLQINEETELLIEFETRIMHAEEKSVGAQFLKFISMDIASYRHFKNLMVLNSPDPEKLLEELHQNPGLVQDAEQE